MKVEKRLCWVAFFNVYNVISIIFMKLFSNLK